MAGRKTYDAEKLTTCLSHFRVKNAEKLPEDHEYLFNLRDVFKKAYELHKDRIKEIKFYDAEYIAKKPPDFFDQTDGSKEMGRMLFNSNIISDTAKTYTSFQLKESPVWDIDPYAVENFKQNVMYNAATNKLGWFEEGIEKHNGFVYEDGPDGEKQLVDINEAGALEFFDDLIDQNIIRWLHHDNSKQGILNVLCTHGYLHGRGDVQIRIVENKPGAWPGSGPHIILENIPQENIIEDPLAKSIGDRKIYFHIKPMDVRDIAKEYGINEDKIKAIPEYSEFKENFDVTDGENKFKVRRALVVRAFCYDDTTVDLETASQFEIYDEVYVYPNGRVITFIPGQETESGLWILKDEANDVVGGPVFSFFPDPIDDLHGRAPAQDAMNDHLIATECVQLGQANLRANGNDILFYEEGEEANIQNLSNQIGIKQKVNSIGAIQYHKPQNMLTEAMDAHIFFSRHAKESVGINTPSEGDNYSKVVSGKAMMIENGRVSQTMSLSVNQYANTLSRIGTGYFSLFLSIAKAGYKVIYDKKWHKLPLPLDMFLWGADINVMPDSIMPIDPVSQANTILTLGNMIAEDGGPVVGRKHLIKTLRVDNAEEILADADEAAGLKNIIQELTQQNEMLQQQMQEYAAALQKAEDEVERAKFAMKTQAGSAQIKQQSMEIQEQYRTLRQQMSDDTEKWTSQVEANTKQINELRRILSAEKMAASQTPKGGPVVED
ncbi:hypothetical protein [Sulfuricurvum sp.]|uniref:hypothetical protein n=1 Tax=Sulfuricurvum sp. TaxID=2025608 RepID=UPI0035686B35